MIPTHNIKWTVSRNNKVYGVYLILSSFLFKAIKAVPRIGKPTICSKTSIRFSEKGIGKNDIMLSNASCIQLQVFGGTFSKLLAILQPWPHATILNIANAIIVTGVQINSGRDALSPYQAIILYKS